MQPGQKRDVLMHPRLIGMFNCGKMLPPQLNLVLEIEFAEPEQAMRAGRRPRKGPPSAFVSTNRSVSAENT